MTIHNNFSLKHLNTFAIDVKAKYYVELFTEIELIDFLKSYQFKSEPLLILGGGSNILFTKNFDGTVLKNSSRGISVIGENDSDIIIKAEAGEVWEDFVSYCVKNNYYGIENLSLVPGTVGAAPIQNIGAYGVELKDIFDSLEGYIIETAEKKMFRKDECQFEYRNSIFKKELKDKFIITSVTFRLSKTKKFNLTYRALKDYFNNANIEQLTIEQVSDAVKHIRMSKLPDIHKLGNAGSFFKNPEITEEHLMKLHKQFPDIVSHKLVEGCYKIPAGWLIEKCGFKGKKFGNTGSFEKQALVIVNYGNADGKEIKDYSEKIQAKVFKTFGIKLETEVNII